MTWYLQTARYWSLQWVWHPVWAFFLWPLLLYSFLCVSLSYTSRMLPTEKHNLYLCRHKATQCGDLCLIRSLFGWFCFPPLTQVCDLFSWSQKRSRFFLLGVWEETTSVMCVLIVLMFVSSLSEESRVSHNACIGLPKCSLCVCS